MEKFKTLQVMIPMAGEGKRFVIEGYTQIKPLIPINGVPMIQAAIDSLQLNDVKYIFITRSEIRDGLSELLKNRYNCEIITIDRLTEGPAITCLKAVYSLDLSAPLVIANCDQIMQWDVKKFIESCNREDVDGLIVTYDSSVPHNSYALLDEQGYVKLVKEKEVISNISLNGIHYWRRAGDFIKSVCKMIAEGDTAPNGEYYIAPSYNHMIQKGAKVIIHHLPPGQHWPVGTPKDLERFISLNEKI